MTKIIILAGWLNNTIEYIPNKGLYESILSLHDILLVTTGHYHENDFCCPAHNKLLCQGHNLLDYHYFTRFDCDYNYFYVHLFKW